MVAFNSKDMALIYLSRILFGGYEFNYSPLQYLKETAAQGAITGKQSEQFFNPLLLLNPIH
jgi:hypothetical protein